MVAQFTRTRRRARSTELAEFWAAADAGVWAGRGFRSPSAWLSAATGESIGACKRALHLGERLTRMPLVAEVFAAGDLSESALGLLADAWAEPLAEVFGRDEEMLVGWAHRLALHDFKLVLSTWVANADPNRVERTAQDRYNARRLHISELLDGMHAVDGLLDGEGAEYVNQAIRFLARPAEHDSRTAAQRRADALVAMARFVVEHHDIPTGVKRRKPTIVATIPYEDLLAQSGVGWLGSHEITTEAVRRLACDAGIHRMVTHGHSAVCDYGRQTRTISDALYELLFVRDGGCRWPGCDVEAAFCDAHHALHWGDLGETEPENLALLCWHHHHCLHEQHFSLEPLGAGHFQLHSPFGSTHETRPPRLTLLGH
jgi:hypothetical protein